MAINFLDDITLNNNEIQNVVIQKLGTDPTGVTGKIIFNTSTNTIKYYNGTGWISLPDGQGMTDWELGDGSSTATISNGQEATFASGTGITTSLGTRTITISNSQPFNGLTLASTSGAASTISDEGTITLAAGTGITTTNNGSGQVTIAATGSGSMSSFTLTGDSGDAQTISDGNTVDIAGGTNITTVVGATDTVTVNLDDTIALAGTFSTEGTGQSSFAGQVTIPTTPVATTDAASKAYVDASTVGNLIFQGGYDAANNEPDLDSSPSSSIKKGWSYVVTDAGTFFTEKVEVGDFLIAKQDAPTALANWVTVQNNIGLATTTTPGIASFPSAEFGVSAAGAVSLVNTGVSAATYGSATEVARFAVNAKGIITAANDETIAIPHTQVTDFDTEVDALVEAREFVGTTTSQTSHVFTHNLGTTNVMVQLFDTSTTETVYADVVRTSTSVVTATTAANASLTALITKIG